MGLPYNWNRVNSWLNFRGPIPNVQLAQYERIELKNSEIPQLENYRIAPGKSFWDKFPSNSENNVVYELNPDALSNNLESVKEKSTTSQYLRGLKAVSYLRKGAPAFQKISLPACTVPNSKASYTYGSLVTDSVATWIKKGFVCGPFYSPPYSKFRSNCLMAVDQHEKIRLALNVSLPED